jgi:hypothetical protein
MTLSKSSLKCIVSLIEASVIKKINYIKVGVNVCVVIIDGKEVFSSLSRKRREREEEREREREREREM